MAKTPTPELVEAYNLIKAGQKAKARVVLKTYIAQNNLDAQAWWLMAHAAPSAETRQRCLETVLKIDPTHAKARAQLAALTRQAPSAAEPPTASPPAPDQIQASETGEHREDDFPSDEMVLAEITGIAAVSSSDSAAPAAPAASSEDLFASTTAAEPPAASPATASSEDLFAPTRPVELPAAETPPFVAPSSFEEFLATDDTSDPFAGPPIDDPFADDPFESPLAAGDGSGTPGRYDPFAAENVFDPSAGVRLRQQQSTQDAGTGNQPDWGPGLAFVTDSSPGTGAVNEVGGTFIPDADQRVKQQGPGTRTVLLVLGGAIVVVIIFALLVYGLDSSGIVNRSGGVPDMTTLDGGTFAIDYPKGWDQRCETEWQGYPVCGIANHRWYNEVDYFAGTDIDLGQMVGDLFGSVLTGEDVPEEAVSIIAMDVPRTSWAYDDKSWAKTLYEWDFGENPTYERDIIEVDGHQAYYYLTLRTECAKIL
jgi:hypothetical protein